MKGNERKSEERRRRKKNNVKMAGNGNLATVGVYFCRREKLYSMQDAVGHLHFLLFV